jgi:CRP-like cAMP-binding protein
VRFDRGEIVFFQGSRHHGNFLIRSGAMRTFYLSPTGKEITLEYWRSGDFLGGPEFFDDTATHVWSAEATEPTIAWRISGAQLADVTARSPAVAAFIMQMMVRKLRLVSSVMQMLANPSLQTRLAQLLVKLVASHGERTPVGIVIDRRFTQNDLANMVGATRQKVSAALSRLRRDNVLRTSNRRLLIVNLAHLERLTTGACDRPSDTRPDR